MLKKMIFFLILSNCVEATLYSQNYFSKHFDLALDNDAGWKILKAKGKYFILSGSVCDHNTVGCSGIFCLDTAFNLQWKLVLDSLLPSAYESLCSDGEYLYYTSSSYINDGREVYLIKYDLLDNEIKKLYLGSYNNRTLVYKINSIDSLLYLTINYWHDNKNSGSDSIQVWYMNRDLELVHSFTETDNYRVEGMVDFVKSNDSMFYGAKLFFLNRRYYGIVKKYDSLGHEIWKSSIDMGSENNDFPQLPRLIATQDGGCAGIWAKTYDSQCCDTFYIKHLIFKKDKEGNDLWSHTFYAKREKYINVLFECKNGDIVLVGDDENTGINSRYKSSGWAARFSPDGKLLWEHSYIDTITITGYSHFINGMEDDNGDLIFCGSIKPRTPINNIINEDIWIVKTDANGCLVPTCDTVQIATGIHGEQILKKNRCHINTVVKDEINIWTDDQVEQEVKTEIFDLHGNLVQKNAHVKIPSRISTPTLNKGYYELRVYGDKGNSFSVFKFIKI